MEAAAGARDALLRVPPSRGWRAVALAMIAVATAQGLSRGTLAAPPPDDLTAPERLIDTGLYASGHPGVVDARNRAFSPQYPLWSDGATKARWVYLPPGTAIDATDPRQWNFPAGTRFWKEFSFNGRKAETRMLWKASSTRWIAASYLWNEDGTDARLAPADGLPGVVEIAGDRKHSIPSAGDCLACHGSRRTGPLGFNALQLSDDRDPNALHAEALAPGMLTLKTLVNERLLSPGGADLVRTPPRIRTASPATRAVLGYLTANCGSCHDGSGEISTFSVSLRHSDLMRDGDAVARSLAGRPSTWQVPGVAEGASVLVDPASPESSAILARMRSRRPSSQMPPLGTVVRDQAAVEAITRWIATDLAAVR
jgi:hypothetical protein